jgi:hypothetical protein
MRIKPSEVNLYHKIKFQRRITFINILITKVWAKLSRKEAVQSSNWGNVFIFTLQGQISK